MTSLIAADRPAKPTRKPLEAPAPPDICTLPTIDGAGLRTEELFRVAGARNRARSVYAQDAPEASPGELDRVADQAASDALRAVLRDRPASPAPATVETDGEGDEDYGDPSEWSSAADLWHWTPTEPGTELVSLDGLLDIQAARFRSFGTRAGDLLARMLSDLAHTARFVGAKTPQDLEARMEVLARDEDREWAPEPELTSAGRWA